jgi:hypothetical protein
MRSVPISWWTVGLVAFALSAILGNGSASAVGADASAVIEAPVPEDAIQTPFDAPSEPVRPPGDEDLGPIDFNRPDGPAAQGYAKKHGVSSSEASKILAWEADVNRQLPDLARDMGDRYAGAELVDLPSGAAVVRVFVFQPTQDDSRLVAGLPGESELVASVDTASGLEARLSAAMADAQRNYPADQRVGGTIDPATGNVILKVRSGSPATICQPSSNETGGQLDGGRGLATKKSPCNGSALCTIGFSSYFHSKQGTLTAAHCVNETIGIVYNSSGWINSAYYDWWMEAKCQSPCNGQADQFSYAALRPYYRDSKPDDDFAFVREKYASTAPTSQLYVAGTGWYTVYGLEDDDNGFPMLGTTVCHAGGRYTVAGPGEYCGEVTDWVDWASAGSTTQRWTEVENYEVADVGGSSGGPAYRAYSYNNVLGMGLMSDQTDDGADAYHFITYERIEPVLDGMAAVTTGFVYCNRGYGLVACSVTY